MLKLKYDIKYGFREMFMTEKNREYSLDHWVTKANEHSSECCTEEDIYNLYKDISQEEFDDIFSDDLYIIAEVMLETAANTIFYKQCHDEQNRKVRVPGYCKVYNLRIELDSTKELENSIEKDSICETGLKANEVMMYLGISRATLCRYVRKGLIKIAANYTGKQNKYDTDSVFKLKYAKK